MNSPEYLTHFKGVPIKAMSRDDVIEVLQHFYRLYNNSLDNERRLLQKSGKALIDHYDHRSLSGG